MRKTVLIIDDFETTLFTLSMTLNACGYDVLKAGSAEEAQQLLDGKPINLIISDYNMPGKNGGEFTQDVRQSKDYRSVPVLMLSTETSPEKRQEALQKGVTAWMKKPYQLDDFKKIVNRLIK